MPLQRWLRIKGKPGSAVSNPWAPGANPPRYAGKQRDPALDGEHEALARYRDVEETMVSHPDLLSACKKGDLELVGQCAAESMDVADKAMAGKATSPAVVVKAVAKKGDL